ncbi:MAG: nuclear transport factor 2 family protein, partial [Chloroflexi bacterium]|nr:nuclear transport factor 2 family protein [Chloroflexota bacterium]
MKRFYFLAALLIGLIVVITACGGPAPAEVVDAHVKALNAGDIAALAAIYTDDVVFSFGPVPPEGAFETLTGKVEVLADDLESIAKNGQLTLSNT